MKLFICSSPYQIINAVNLTTSIFSDEIVDIFILDHVQSNREIYQELKRKKVFKNTVFINSKKVTSGNSIWKIKRYVKAITHYLSSKTITNQFSLNDGTYETIFISSPDIPSRVIYYYYKKKNPNVKLFMFEEGTFAYSYFDYQLSFTKKMFLNLKFGGDIDKDYVGGFVYKPELVKQSKSIPIYKIPSLETKYDKNRNLYNEILKFSPDSSREFNSKHIFFDQAFQFESIIEKGRDLLEVISGLVGEEDITIKLHPRTRRGLYDEKYKISTTSAPFEIILLNHELREKVFFSINSTACLNPKIVFDEEPYVIVLFNLLDFSKNENRNIKLNEIFYKVQSSYKAKGRFFIPESIAELRSAVNLIRSEIDQY